MHKTQEQILELKDVSFWYEREKVLEHINLKLYQNDFLAIIGPNGGGKTTLIKLIIGLLKPKSGEIIHYIDTQIGYVPQDTNLNSDFPIQVIDVVLMGFFERRWFGFRPNPHQKQQAFAYLEKLGIANLAYKKMNELSGGQRQRVLIARALCGDPKLIVLDEPTSSIDKIIQKEIYESLKKINKFHTIIAISHDISVLFRCANRVLFIDKKATLRDMAQLGESKDNMSDFTILSHFGVGDKEKK
ncbi:ABC transporter ATP-binding protein [Helicobacter fennelliae]|uniref:ABC transporter ATP-binding protein n=1 Tax=Helicobacter fennelliae TaxID=215 RepID=A0A2X3BDH0_9HELI|nr:metal ABC transporter ATP-binding protein [Helicobacter fennelliae]SQB98663.1 ABC transporter ATP-binding protein [Helicobacter fennelliae]